MVDLLPTFKAENKSSKGGGDGGNKSSKNKEVAISSFHLANEYNSDLNLSYNDQGEGQ